jgi:hypothetical protein
MIDHSIHAYRSAEFQSVSRRVYRFCFLAGFSWEAAEPETFRFSTRGAADNAASAVWQL